MSHKYFRCLFFTLFILFFLFENRFVRADIYINKLVVNGTDAAKETNINFTLPGDLTAPDILDTNGLDLDYNVNDSAFYLHGKVTLQSKESKTFRIRVKDVWKLAPQRIEDIKKEIEQGYEQIGKQKDPQQGEQLKKYLLEKLDLIQEKSGKADTVEKRMDSFRAYSKELKRIQNNALNVDYWRSDPSEVKQTKVVHFTIEVENPFDIPKTFTNKQFLPSEVSPEDVVEFEGFEVRFDQEKKAPFLFREDQLEAKEKRKYTIGIRDIWYIPQKDSDYLHNRGNSAYDSLKDTKYGSSAKILYDHANDYLKVIEVSQAQKKPTITEYISSYRDNQKNYDNARVNVESLEKLLSVYREDLEKSKVSNVLRKMQSLNGISSISKAVFDKTKVSENDTWKFIFWILVFVGILTVISFIVWILRSKDKNISTTPAEKIEAVDNQAKKQT